MQALHEALGLTAQQATRHSEVTKAIAERAPKGLRLQVEYHLGEGFRAYWADLTPDPLWPGPYMPTAQGAIIMFARAYFCDGDQG